MYSIIHHTSYVVKRAGCDRDRHEHLLSYLSSLNVQRGETETDAY